MRYAHELFFTTMDKIAIIDFGGQYTHLIANRIRRLGVFSEIVSSDISPSDLAKYKGIILSGSPHSVLEERSPNVHIGIFQLGIPILGLCYGHQIMAKSLGGTVCQGLRREYGIAKIKIESDSAILKDFQGIQQIWMSHGDAVDVLPSGFRVLGSTPDCVNAAVGDETRHFYGLQFHPEVTDTPNGIKILSAFIDICKVKREWDPNGFLSEISQNLRRDCGNRKVFLLVSGGVDSTVAFTLLNEALGPERVLGLHIDNGLMRHWESLDIAEYMEAHGFHNLHSVDAGKEFLQALEGVWDPEQKRVIIGNTFLSVQKNEQKRLGLNTDEWLLGQGTIYPDTIESAGTQHADKIKTHHNRVDIILDLIKKGLVIEPLAQLYKDEVRMLGEKLGLPKKLVWRHPFPGPGLGVRTLCSDGTPVEMSVDTGDQVRRLAAESGYEGYVLPVRSVGVQGDGRTYAHPALLTGERNWECLEQVSTSITNNVSGINRVVFGISLQEPVGYRLIEGYVTKKRLDKLRKVDNIVTETLYDTGEYEKIWQMPVVLLPLVNSRGGECVVLRPIRSQEAMTARFVPLYDTTISKIVNQIEKIEGIGDIFFDITHKPPGTIEWE